MHYAPPPRLAGLRALGLRVLEAQQGRFALWLPVVAIGGAAAYFGLRAEPPWWLTAALVVPGAALARLRGRMVLHAAGLALLYAAFGFGAAQFAASRAPGFPLLPSRAVQIDARIIDHDVLPAGARLTLDRVALDGAPIGKRRIRLRVTGDSAALQPGAWISVRGRIMPPPPPAFPGGRDLQRDAWFDGLGGYGYALGRPVLVRAAPQGRIARLRDAIAARVRAALPGPEGAVGATLLSGLSAAIPPEDRAAFRDAGLAHLLAIAGLHIGIVMGLVLALARFALTRSARIALFWPVRQIAALASLAAGFAYLLLTGLHVPTLRSFVMAALVVVALLAGRRALSLRSWGLAALAVIAVAPEQVTGPSFQLSFAAVLALIAGYEVARAPLQLLRAGGRWRTAAHHVITLALTSALAGVASLPFIAVHFGQIQLYFIAANLIAVPLTALWVMPLGLLGLALMPFGLERLALVPMGWGIGAILRVAYLVAGLPGATIAVPHAGTRALLPVALGLAWLCLWRGRLRSAAAIPILLGGLILLTTKGPDVLIAPDARLVGIREGGRLYVHEVHGGDSYTEAAWTQYLGLPALPWPCPQQGCRLGEVQLGGRDAPCGAKVIIALQGAPPYCAGALEISRSKLFRDGAAALWLGAPPTLQTDRGARGARPWVFLPPEQERLAIGLPFAKTE